MILGRIIFIEKMAVIGISCFYLRKPIRVFMRLLENYLIQLQEETELILANDENMDKGKAYMEKEHY